MKTVNKLIKTFCLIISFLVLGTVANAATVVVGDVNGDGTVTMSDANVVVNYYLATTKPSDFNKAAGDVNNDGDITMSDANIIVNMFLSGNTGDPANGHEYVDLGISVKWATCNVGADNPWDYGDYFAWGETETKSKYGWGTYKWCNLGNPYILTKYNTMSNRGTVDDNTTLEPADDAATANWHGAWRMPTQQEQTALCDSCYWEWTTDYNSKGVAGYIVYKAKADADMGKKKTSGRNITTLGTYTLSDTHIFLPTTGHRNGNNLDYAGSYGEYWSASLEEGGSNCAWGMNFELNDVGCYFNERYSGFSVRAVLP